MKKDLTTGSVLLKHFDRLEVLITFRFSKNVFVLIGLVGLIHFFVIQTI